MDRASSSSDVAAAAVGERRTRLLVLDDSATMRRSMEMALRLGGYEVTVAENGARGLELLHTGYRPDLVLTDIVMPEVDGLAFIREARKILRFTPIVALTTQGQRALRDQGKAAGATAWLIKPTGGRDLLDMIERFVPQR